MRQHELKASKTAGIPGFLCLSFLSLARQVALAQIAAGHSNSPSGSESIQELLGVCVC